MTCSAAREVDASTQASQALHGIGAGALKLHGMTGRDAVQTQDALGMRRAAELAHREIQQRDDRVPVRHLGSVIEARRANVLGQLEPGQRVGRYERAQDAAVHPGEVAVIGQAPRAQVIERFGNEPRG